MQELIQAISHVNSWWSYGAFAVAAAVLLWKSFLKGEAQPQPAPANGEGPAAAPQAVGGGPGSPSNSLIWGGVIVICFLGGLPIIARSYVDTHPVFVTYRVRAVVVDERNVPLSGATLTTTASNETTTTHQGVGEVSIYRGTMPADGRVTIFADVSDQYLHGSADIVLSKEPNPSVKIQVKPDGSATVPGLVENETRHAIAGATVSVAGGETVKTAQDGTFLLKTNAAVGQTVRLHVEKDGCSAVDQEHPAGRGDAIITLSCKKKRLK